MLRDSIKPIHIIIASSVLAVIAIFIIFTQIYNVNNPVTISKVPSDARLYVDDKEVIGDRTNLKNGTYRIRATRDGFYDLETNVVISEYNQSIFVGLQPKSDEAIKWAEENQDLYIQQEGTPRSPAETEAGEAFISNNPIVRSLPAGNSLFSVGYIIDSNDATGKSIIVTVHAPGGFRNAAVQQIYNLGFDPGDYRIQFSDFTNPFKENL